MFKLSSFISSNVQSMVMTPPKFAHHTMQVAYINWVTAQNIFVAKCDVGHLEDPKSRADLLASIADFSRTHKEYIQATVGPFSLDY